MTLWHFTCEHGHQALGQTGRLLPPRIHAADKPWASLGALAWMAEVVWLTDQRDGFGAVIDRPTSDGCKRRAYRYMATGGEAQRWGYWAHERGILPAARWMLESAENAWPATWFVSEGPVPVVLAQPDMEAVG